MRSFILCALVATAVLASKSASSRYNWSPEVDSSVRNAETFRVGQEYRFHYDIQIASGLPVPGSEHALTRGQCFVSLSIKDENTALLQLTKCRSGSSQKELNEPKKIAPFDATEEIKYSEETEKALQLPLRFRYDKQERIISDIVFDGEDQPWSINVKKSILNVLQFDLSKKNVIPEMNESASSLREEEITYRTSEMTLEGECEVLYTIPESQEKELRVTKSINFENCTKRVGTRYNFRFGDDCPSCENKYTGAERNIESSTVLNARLSGTPRDFVIKEVELLSQYIYSPLNEKETFFNTFVASKLTLIEVVKASRIPEPENKKESESLLASTEHSEAMERFFSEGDESVFPDNSPIKVENKPEIVSRLVKAIIAGMEKKEIGMELQTAHDTARLVKMLRLSKKEEIRRIHKEVCENSDLPEKQATMAKDIINDALAIAGTANTVEHLVEKIRNQKMSSMKASLVLKQLSNIRTPSAKIVDSLISLCKEQKRQPLERQSCWLTVGSVLNGMCGEHRDVLAREEKTCPRNIKQKYVDQLFELFNDAESRYEKILALKTIANAGMDLAVFPLEKIIKDGRQEKTIRVQAVDALRKLRSVMPRKIHSILMPVFKNIYEKPELRISAFHQIMQTIPERVVIDQMTEQLSREPSHQVHSFVVSALRSLSESEVPCEKRMAEDITVSLRLARVTPRKVLDSRYAHYTQYSEELKAGGSLNFAALFSNDSVLPKEVMTTLETAFAGQWNKYLAQIGFSQENLDLVISRITEQVEKKGLSEILVRGKRASSGFRPAEMLRDLFSKLAIKTRSISESDPHALVYIRFRDQDYALLPISEEVLPEMMMNIIRSGRLETSELESILSKGYSFDTLLSSFVYERTRHLTTSAGLPIIFSSKMPTIFRMNGKIEANILPKNGDRFDGLRVRVQAEPQLVSTHVSEMEILSPIVNHGVKLIHSLQANLPIDSNMELSWKDGLKMKTDFVVPQENRRLIHVSSRPAIYTRVWPAKSRVYVEAKEKTVYVDKLETLVHRIETSVLEKATGMKINVDGHIHGHIFEQGVEGLPSALLIGENNLVVDFEKTSKTPEKVEFTFEMENFKEESRSEQPEFESFYEKENEEHFNVEESEWETEEGEKERRSSFSKYVNDYKSGKTYKHRLSASVRTIGGRKEEKKAEIEVLGWCDEQVRSCKLSLKGERTPVTEEESRNWKLEATTKVLYPAMPESLEELLNQKHREVVAESEAKWGAQLENSVNVKLQGEQNKEQKVWMKHAVEQKNRKTEEKLSALEQYSRLFDASMLNQYKIVAKYDIRSPVTVQVSDRLYSALKAASPFFRTELSFDKNEPRIVRASLTLEPETRRYVNVTIETPRELLKISEFRLPIALRLANIRAQPVPIRSLYQLTSRAVDGWKAECTVESRKVRSFDDLVYRTPLTTCYSVLAKDCSSEEPEFAVLMKKVEKKGEEKKMKIITRETVIELEKIRKSEEMKITINGEETTSEKKLSAARVFQNGADLVIVELDDVKVSFDGYTAEVKMSELYKNKQCGLCGHFDGEKKNEFRRADNEETEDMEEFHRSFLVKGDECEIEEEELKEKTNYRIESDDDESSSEEENVFEKKSWEKKSSKKSDSRKYNKEEKQEIEPIRKTRVIEYSNTVCFSTEAVPECPRRSHAEEESLVEKKIKLTCLPRSSNKAQRLIRESRNSILSLEEFPVNRVETIEVPKMCLAF